MKIYILLAYVFSGCDTTSVIYGKGKKLLMKSIANDSVLKKSVNTFKRMNARTNEVKKAGETPISTKLR